MTSILALDTASRSASISITQDSNRVLEYNFSSKDELSSTLLPAIEFLLKNASLEINDLDMVGIAVGPGLFTGIRIGMAMIKGLLLNSNIPLIPVNTLEAQFLKYGVHSSTPLPQTTHRSGAMVQGSTPLVSLMDARRKEVYAAAYALEEKVIKEILPPALVRVNELKDFLKGLDEFKLIGHGAKEHHLFLGEEFKQQILFHRSNFLAPEIAVIAEQRFQRNETITDLQQLMPLYIRKPDAEQNLLTKK